MQTKSKKKPGPKPRSAEQREMYNIKVKRSTHKKLIGHSVEVETILDAFASRKHTAFEQ